MKCWPYCMWGIWLLLGIFSVDMLPVKGGLWVLMEVCSLPGRSRTAWWLCSSWKCKTSVFGLTAEFMSLGSAADTNNIGTY